MALGTSVHSRGASAGRAHLTEHDRLCWLRKARNLWALLVLLAWTKIPPLGWEGPTLGIVVSVAPAMVTRLVVAPDLVPFVCSSTLSGLLAFAPLRLRKVYSGRKLQLRPNAVVVPLPLERVATSAVLRLTISGLAVEVVRPGVRALV